MVYNALEACNYFAQTKTMILFIVLDFVAKQVISISETSQLLQVASAQTLGRTTLYIYAELS